MPAQSRQARGSGRRRPCRPRRCRRRSGAPSGWWGATGRSMARPLPCRKRTAIRQRLLLKVSWACSRAAGSRDSQGMVGWRREGGSESAGGGRCHSLGSVEVSLAGQHEKLSQGGFCDWQSCEYKKPPLPPLRPRPPARRPRPASRLRRAAARPAGVQRALAHGVAVEEPREEALEAEAVPAVRARAVLALVRVPETARRGARRSGRQRREGEREREEEEEETH